MSHSTESSPPVPDDSTIFTNLPQQFPALDSNGKIKTREFLDASAGLVTLIEKMGKTFSPVVYDMNGNIKKLNEKFQENQENYKYLEDMILVQLNEAEMRAVDALQWLRRALYFFTRFFEQIISDSDRRNNTQDLSGFVKNAYRESLERYHGWLGTQLLNILSRFVPNKKDLFYSLALDKHNKDELVLRDLRLFTQKMSTCVQKLVDFYQEHNLETNQRVVNF